MGHTPWFGWVLGTNSLIWMVLRTNSLIWMGAWHQLLDLHECMGPTPDLNGCLGSTPWFEWVFGTNSFIWMSACDLHLIWNGAWDQLLDSDVPHSYPSIHTFVLLMPHAIRNQVDTWGHRPVCTPLWLQWISSTLCLIVIVQSPAVCPFLECVRISPVSRRVCGCYQPF